MRLPIWTRIEPEGVGRDVDAGLAAPVADPSWLLGRQWQVGELTAEDAATPVAVEIDWATYPIESVDVAGVSRPFEAGIPLEAVIEPEPPTPVSWRTRLTSGRALIDELRALGATPTVPATLAPRAIDEPAARALARLMGTTALDAEAVLQLPSPTETLTALGLSPSTSWLAATSVWLGWYRARTGRAAPSAWVAERAAYQATLGATTAEGRVSLAIDEYRGGRLDWAELRLTTTPTPASTNPVRQREVLLPAPIGFRGGPARRFFEFEDGEVDFGGLGETGDDLASRLLVEVALIYGGDWFVVPVELPVGGLARLERVAVRSGFGDLTTIAAPRASDRWRAFTLTALPEYLPLLPVVSRALDGPVLERVTLARDEGANLAWLIEHTIADGLDRGRRIEPDATPPAGSAPLDRYRPMVSPPPGWRPWIQRGDALVAATMSAAVPPARGHLARTLVRMRADQVGREGLAIERRWQVATARDGRPRAWLNRRQTVGVGDLPSGIGFDVLELGADH